MHTQAHTGVCVRTHTVFNLQQRKTACPEGKRGSQSSQASYGSVKISKEKTYYLAWKLSITHNIPIVQTFFINLLIEK